MTKKLFEIENFILQDDKIFVNILKRGKEESIKINRAEYEKWLISSGRLEWINDSVSYNGEHEQDSGTIAIDNYWNDINVDKDNDLYDWILLKWVAEDVFEIKQPLSNILGFHFFTSLTTAI